MLVHRAIGGAFGAAQFLCGQRYLKLVGRLVFSVWLDAQSNFPQFWQTLGRLLQMTVRSLKTTAGGAPEARLTRCFVVRGRIADRFALMAEPGVE